MDRRKFVRIGLTGTGTIIIGSGLSYFFVSCRKDKPLPFGGGHVEIIEGDFTTLLTEPLQVGLNANFKAQVTKFQIIDGTISKVLGYQEDAILGATIIVNNGDNFQLNLINNLSESTNIHWHGLDVPANMDGGPMNLVGAGNTFSYSFQIQQRAAMYWYHPHPHGRTGKQVALGLGGLFIVRDAEEQALNLPSGEFEVALILQDKKLNPDDSINYNPMSGDIMTGYLGERVLVNGKHGSRKNVSRESYRLRILNASNARIYNISFSDNSPFTIIGSDGGLLANSILINSLLLGPGERADIIMDFSNYSLGNEIFLISKLFNGGDAQGLQSFKILKFVVTSDNYSNFVIHSTLSSFNVLSEAMVIKSRYFDISNAGADHGAHGETGMVGMHRINNKIYSEERIDETVNANSIESWTFDNSLGSEPHPMHVHGVQFQISERVGGRNIIEPHELGWKDTILVMPNEKVKIIVKFGNYLGKYVLHCHNLEHEDDGMMLQFEVV